MNNSQNEGLIHGAENIATMTALHSRDSPTHILCRPRQDNRAVVSLRQNTLFLHPACPAIDEDTYAFCASIIQNLFDCLLIYLYHVQ